MITLPLGESLQEILVLGAHCDDVEIGCGGTLALLGRACPDVRIRIAVFSGEPRRAAETRAAIARLLPQSADVELTLHGFRDAFFPVEWPHIKQRFEELKNGGAPGLVLTHYEQDRHQDHRIISELTWNTFRDHLVLEYEIPKWDGDLGRPNFFVSLPTDVVDHKIATLLGCFESQIGKPWFSADLFRGIMRIRGMEFNSPSGFAEAFYARKVVGGFRPRT